MGWSKYFLDADNTSPLGGLLGSGRLTCVRDSSIDWSRGASILFGDLHGFLLLDHSQETLNSVLEVIVDGLVRLAQADLTAELVLFRGDPRASGL